MELDNYENKRREFNRIQSQFFFALLFIPPSPLSLFLSLSLPPSFSLYLSLNGSHFKTMTSVWSSILSIQCSNDWHEKKDFFSSFQEKKIFRCCKVAKNSVILWLGIFITVHVRHCKLKVKKPTSIWQIFKQLKNRNVSFLF